MVIGIIGAMDEEIEILLKEMKNKKEITVANCLFVKGYLSDKEAVLLKSGIGKTNAAMSTTILHERFAPSLIINTGSAGGFQEHFNVGDIVISTKVVYHDVDVTAFDYALGQVPGMPAAFQSDSRLVQIATDAVKKLKLPYAKGMVATGDSFMADPDHVAAVKKNFPGLIAAEMEAAAIAQVCYQYNVPFVVLRALSDIAGKESSVTFDEFLETAAKNASAIVMEMVKKLGE